MSQSFTSLGRLMRPTLVRPLPHKNLCDEYPFACGDRLDDSESMLPQFENHLPQEIISGLFLGSADHCSEFVLKLLNITHVVNCADFSENGFPLHGIKPENYLALSILDTSTYNILSDLTEAVKFIKTAIIAGGIILVCCHRGISRSAAVVIAYLMATDARYRTFDDAYMFVRSKRSIINPNFGFCVALKMSWQRRISDSVPSVST